ncbi:MAG: hypothetical protein JO240_09175 [Solirubrobacterales bacterium]|nr:hypothetical protein [Solirubrobacterales bacterium]
MSVRLKVLAAGLAVAAACGAPAMSAAATSLRSRVFADGAKLKLSSPDDLTLLGDSIFAGFQNGVGAQGQPSTTGNRDSTIVEFTPKGNVVRRWRIVGKCDGLGADPATGRVVATVNEDGNSSLYVINPRGAAVHYRYSKLLRHHGGTDAVTFYNGSLLISASAPGTTGASAPQAAYPAVYRVTFDDLTRAATAHPVFYDEAKATNAITHKRTKLGLTDPDSSNAVPSFVPRFGGEFMLNSQGDQQEIFLKGRSLTVLPLSTSVDDAAFPSDANGSLLVTDNHGDKIYRITGHFRRGSALVADTPCNANSAPSTCPAPGFASNSLAELNLRTGKVTPLTINGAQPAAQGLLYVP